MLAKATAAMKAEWAKREATLSAEQRAGASVLQPKLQEAYAKMDEKSRAVMDNPAAFISENPAVITGVILPALCAVDFPGASLMSKAVKLLGVAEMAAPLIALISASGNMAKPPAK